MPREANYIARNRNRLKMEIFCAIRRNGVWIVAIAALVLTQSAPAWTEEGHQAVGAIADTLIKGHAAEQHVKQLLGTETLSTASVWADQAKGYGAQTDEMEEFREK